MMHQAATAAPPQHRLGEGKTGQKPSDPPRPNVDNLQPSAAYDGRSSPPTAYDGRSIPASRNVGARDRPDGHGIVHSSSGRGHESRTGDGGSGSGSDGSGSGNGGGSDHLRQRQRHRRLAWQRHGRLWNRTCGTRHRLGIAVHLAGKVGEALRPGPIDDVRAADLADMLALSADERCWADGMTEARAREAVQEHARQRMGWQPARMDPHAAEFTPQSLHQASNGAMLHRASHPTTNDTEHESIGGRLNPAAVSADAGRPLNPAASEFAMGAESHSIGERLIPSTRTAHRGRSRSRDGYRTEQHHYHQHLQQQRQHQQHREQQQQQHPHQQHAITESQAEVLEEMLALGGGNVR